MKRLAPLSLILLMTPFAAMAGGPATPMIEPVVAAPVPMAPVTPNVIWTGSYAGLSLGGGNSYGTAPGNHSTLGIVGVNLGYRNDFGPVVLGGEISYDKDNVWNGNGNGNTITSTGAIKLILGKSLGQTLVYGTAGFVQAQADVVGVSRSDTGYTFGIGADYALNDKWTVGGELATDRYNKFSNTGYDLNDTTFKVKVGFRF
jgi:outer membrane immunogenic protein